MDYDGEARDTRGTGHGAQEELVMEGGSSERRQTVRVDATRNGMRGGGTRVKGICLYTTPGRGLAPPDPSVAGRENRIMHADARPM